MPSPVSTWMGDLSLHTNYAGTYPTTQINSAFHPSGVDKSSTRWQVGLCDPTTGDAPMKSYTHSLTLLRDADFDL